MNTTLKLRLLATAGALLLAGTAVHADDWPAANRPITMLVGSSPGGGTDSTARAVADKLGPLLNTTIIVTNRPGASNTIASNLTSKATDGYTMMMGVSTATAIAPHLMKLGYDNDKDLVPVAYVAAVPNVLVVNKNLGVNTVAQLIDYIKAHPETSNFASSGSGSTQHIAAELFMESTGLKINHIPYRGSAPALVDLMGGQVQMTFDTMASVLPQIKSGGVKALAVLSATRSPQLPQVPTMAEAGVKNVEMSAWYGIYMPATTPKAVQDKVAAAVEKVLQMPETKARLETFGAVTSPMTQAQFIAFHQSENKRYAELIQKRGIKLD
jgi:tripartite-type tricarboxylate transporter receptor subunit TctC